MTQPDLELIKLRKVYPGGTVAVEGFDLQVARGEFISFVGPSGCGKTTTLRMIAGLEGITSGDLIIRGANMTRVPPEKRPTATIFQNYALFPHMSVWENIAFGLRVRGLSETDVKSRTDQMIDTLDLGAVAGAKERSLSGGQRQRVALARGLVTQPEILLLDEPLGALDANLRKAIQEELKILQRELGITFVFVTHAQAEALSMGDRVVVMNSGVVEQISPPFELYTRPRSPFVATFIGRNKIIEGTLGEVSNGHATLSTRFGPLKGVPTFDTAKAPSGANAMIVAPSEYVDVKPSGEGEGDTIPGTVTALDAVGQVVYVTVRLDERQTVRLETYRDKVGGTGIAPGSAVDLSFSPERASVVLA